MKIFKRNFKLIISLIILANIIIAIVFINIRGTNTYAAVETTIEGVNYKVSEAEEILMITGSGKVTDAWKTSDNLSRYKERITKVTIGKNITRIDNSAFEGCTNLREVIFTPSSQCTYIAENAFKDCSATLSITISTTQEIDYIIPQGGIYKIEAHGGKGKTVELSDGRRGTGAKGGKTTGYIQLRENDKLSTKLYEGGIGGKGSRNGVTVKGSDGGKGIGIILNENTSPFIASGGGSGVGGYGICEEGGHFHGEWVSRTEFASEPGYELTTGKSGKNFKYYCEEVDCTKSTNRLVATGRRRRRVSSRRKNYRRSKWSLFRVMLCIREIIWKCPSNRERYNRIWRKWIQ